MKKYIYVIFGLFYLLFSLILATIVMFDSSVKFENDIIPNGAVSLHITSIKDSSSFERTLENIVEQNELYVVQKSFTEKEGVPIKTFYINKDDFLKGIDYYNNEKLIGDKYIGTYKSNDANQIGYKKNYRDSDTRIMDLQSNWKPYMLNENYYIYKSDMSTEDYAELLSPLEEAVTYSITPVISASYSIFNDMGLMLIMLLIIVVVFYMIILYEKTRLKKMTISLMYGKDIIYIVNKEYIHFLINLNVIAIIIYIIVKQSMNLKNIDFLLYEIISLIIINLSFYTLLYFYIRTIENKEIIMYIKNNKKYKLSKIDFIVKFILSVLILFAISMLLYSVVELSRTLNSINKYWNLDSEYLQVDGYNLGEDGNDDEKINEQLQGAADEIRKNGGIYAHYSQEENILTVSPEYFELNSLKLSSGKNYVYADDKPDRIFVEEVSNDEFITDHSSDYDDFIYEGEKEFPTYDIETIFAKNPIIIVERKEDNIDYITHTLIPIKNSREQTVEYYNKILVAEDADDNIVKVSTLDDEIMNQKRIVIIKIGILGVILFTLVVLYLAIQSYIIKIYIFNNRKKIGIYKLYELPRNNIYIDMYKNIIFSYFVLFLILVIISFFKHSIYIWISFLGLLIFEFFILKYYIKVEESKRILEIIKGV